MSKNTDELLDHEYDGIREFDNPIPGWWHWIFWASIAFAGGYFSYFHLMGGPGVLASYEQEMERFEAIQEQRQAEALASISEEKLQAAMHDTELVALGKTTYDAKCAACHADKGQGLVGPNLTDAFWLHSDGSLMSIRAIIATGVPEKGMPAWEKLLTPEELVAVVGFVGTLVGTNVEGKEPEGEAVESAELGTHEAEEEKARGS